ncbi:hypothetical protein S231_00980 [Candidatus Phytoplasma solani]|nr:hypothetical protein S231_00980 [Candidatus Phytoplasma solani]
MKIILFIGLGLFLIINSNKVMGMKNDIIKDKINIKNKQLSINDKNKVIIKHEPVTFKDIQKNR